MGSGFAGDSGVNGVAVQHLAFFQGPAKILRKERRRRACCPCHGPVTAVLSILFNASPDGWIDWWMNG
eukprot:363784-Chlamydomonas_euryale.AAC.1